MSPAFLEGGTAPPDTEVGGGGMPMGGAEAIAIKYEKGAAR
jgi:hypothetical protein